MMMQSSSWYTLEGEPHEKEEDWTLAEHRCRQCFLCCYASAVLVFPGQAVLATWVT